MDINLVWKIVNFVILFLLLYKLLGGYVKNFFENRSITIKKDIEEADIYKKETERRYEELKKKLENIDKEIQDLTALFEREGLAEKERIIEKARNEAEKIKEQAFRIIEQEVGKAKLMLRKEYAELIVKMSENMIQKKLTGKDQQRIFEEYIEKVGQLN